MYSSYIKFRASENLKTMLKDWSTKSGISESEIIRSALFAYFGRESNRLDIIPSQSTKKVYLTIPEFIVDCAKRRAIENGMSLSGYITAMLQSNLTDFPVFHEKEVQALDECRTELRRIGNNVNQLSKHFNTTLNDFNPEGYKVFRALYKDVLNLKSAISDLIAASSGVYGRNRN